MKQWHLATLVASLLWCIWYINHDRSKPATLDWMLISELDLTAKKIKELNLLKTKKKTTKES